jgi:mismatch-specific thymine-DNA glycosylase
MRYVGIGHQIVIRVEGIPYKTLADILPDAGPMKMLIVGKTPAPVSVAAGHYFQGRQGQLFWSALRAYRLLDVPDGTQPDDSLLAHGYGLTDIVKLPRSYGSEPSDDEYRQGLPRILDLIERLRPRVVMFAYKGVLDKVLKFGFRHASKSKYGFNPDLDSKFNTSLFVFPMPGTPCTRAQASAAMEELVKVSRRKS